MIYSHHSGIKTQKLVYLQAWLKKFYWIPHSQPILVSIKQLVTIRCPWQPLTARPAWSECPSVPVTPPSADSAPARLTAPRSDWLLARLGLWLAASLDWSDPGWRVGELAQFPVSIGVWQSPGSVCPVSPCITWLSASHYRDSPSLSRGPMWHPSVLSWSLTTTHSPCSRSHPDPGPDPRQARPPARCTPPTPTTPSTQGSRPTIRTPTSSFTPASPPSSRPPPATPPCPGLTPGPPSSRVRVAARMTGQAPAQRPPPPILHPPPRLPVPARPGSTPQTPRSLSFQQLERGPRPGRAPPPPQITLCPCPPSPSTSPPCRPPPCSSITRQSPPPPAQSSASPPALGSCRLEARPTSASGPVWTRTAPPPRPSPGHSQPDLLSSGWRSPRTPVHPPAQILTVSFKATFFVRLD